MGDEKDKSMYIAKVLHESLLLFCMPQVAREQITSTLQSMQLIKHWGVNLLWTVKPFNQDSNAHQVYPIEILRHKYLWAI